jgi:hypothetical protein
MAEKEAKFSAGGGKLKIEILFGQNKTGTCSFVLLDKNNKNLEHGSGTKSRNTFDIQSDLNALDGALLTWDADINGPDKPNQKWKITMTIKQDGSPIEGGVIPNSDPPTFQLIHVMGDEVRLKAK